MMKDLLFLCHRIPFPPNKGDKIRSYHLWKFLASRYRVHMGAFVDNPEDWQYVDSIKEIIQGECCFIGLNPKLAKARSLSGFLTGEALTFPYYKNRKMGRWVKQILREKPIKQIVVYSAALCQYVLGEEASAARRTVDFVDIDSAKWEQYAKETGGINRWIFNREAEKLLSAERKIASIFDASLFVSTAEADLFKTLAPELTGKTDHWNNGVDSDFFSPKREYVNPYPPDQIPMVFTGAMDYRPNIDAVVWFANEILPGIREQVKKSQFIIAGGGATPEVQRLGQLPGVTVTGGVADMRPYIAHAAVSVAPLRLARGVQNKVLEAMAMARPVVATSQAIEGIHIDPGMEKWVCDQPEGFARLVLELLGENREPGGGDTQLAADVGEAGYRCVLKKYKWEDNLKRALRALEPDLPC